MIEVRVRMFLNKLTLVIVALVKSWGKSFLFVFVTMSVIDFVFLLANTAMLMGSCGWPCWWLGGQAVQVSLRSDKIQSSQSIVFKYSPPAVCSAVSPSERIHSACFSIFNDTALKVTWVMHAWLLGLKFSFRLIAIVFTLNWVHFRILLVTVLLVTYILLSH